MFRSQLIWISSLLITKHLLHPSPALPAKAVDTPPTLKAEGNPSTMSTSAQVLANQANSQHSTGPRSADGKKRSSKNATRHGICSKDLVILPGEEDEFALLLKGLSNELDPAGHLEEVLFQQIVHGAWNLRRCRRAEAEVLARSSDPTLDPLLDDTNEPKLRRIDIYARRAQSEFSRAMKELKAIQTERQYRVEAQPPQPGEDFEETMSAQSPLINYQSIESRLITQDHRRNAAAARALEAEVHAIMAAPLPGQTKPIASARGN